MTRTRLPRAEREQQMLDAARSLLAFVDSDRDAWPVLFGETLPGGEVARHVAAQAADLLAATVVPGLRRQSEPARDRATG